MPRTIAVTRGYINLHSFTFFFSQPQLYPDGSTKSCENAMLVAVSTMRAMVIAVMVATAQVIATLTGY